MPDIGAYHPQIAHFVVALLIVGVGFRVMSLTGWFAFTGPAATTLILLGTLATVAGVKSGTDAHGPVERMPGVRAAVQEHEDWGKRARNIFLGVAAADLIALGLAAAKSKRARLVASVSALAGLAGLAVVYEAAEHGGRIVYTYAGGVGIRSGDPSDVGRLLLAGLYQQAALDRKAGRLEDSAELIDSAVRRFPDAVDVQLMGVESLIDDRKNPAAALAKLSAMPPPGEDRLRIRVGMLKVSAHEAAGNRGAARAELETLRAAFPDSQAVLRRMKEFDAK